MRFFWVFSAVTWFNTFVNTQIIHQRNYAPVENLDPKLSFEILTHEPQAKVSPQDLPAFIGSSDLASKTFQAEKMVYRFHCQLHSFISDSHFDTFRFGVMANKLIEDLRVIVQITSEVVLEFPDLEKQLRFTFHMLHQMIYSAKILDDYSFVGSAETYLLNKVVDLNIRILRLCNSLGKLDKSSSCYLEKLLGFCLELVTYGDNFRELEGISSVFRVFFEEQLLKAKELAWFLVNQLYNDS